MLFQRHGESDVDRRRVVYEMVDVLAGTGFSGAEIRNAEWGGRW